MLSRIYDVLFGWWYAGRYPAYELGTKLLREGPLKEKEHVKSRKLSAAVSHLVAQKMIKRQVVDGCWILDIGEDLDRLLVWHRGLESSFCPDLRDIQAY